jgi:outer membrane protein, heavy metal efflux system
MRLFTIRTIWKRSLLWTGGLTAFATGCAAPDGPPLLPTSGPGLFAHNYARPAPGASSQRAANPIRQAAFQEPAAPAEPVRPVTVAESATVGDFVRLAVERNPRLAKANFAIDAARGRHLQAGLYPNPEVAVNWDELGDRSSPDRLGILTAPKVSQTIVTGNKLGLARAVAAREVDQATLELISERFAIVGSVRAAFYEALALQRRAEVLAELVKLADEAVAGGRSLLDAKPPQIARLDFIQLEVERERFRAELQAVRKELPGAYRRLAAVAGAPAMIPTDVAGTLDGPPEYDPDAVREAVLAYHPQVRAARIGVDRAQAAVRRAEVEPIPNVSV